MKVNKFLKIFLITISIGVLSACESDDAVDEGANAVRVNEVKVNTNRFEITNAILLDDGTFNGITEFELYLTSTGVTVDTNSDINGSGDFLTLRLFSSEQTNLAEGTYVYNNQDNTSLLLNRGSHFFGFDASLGDGQEGSQDIEAGNIIVVLENNQYTITINLTDEEGESLTGYYNGTINILD